MTHHHDITQEIRVPREVKKIVLAGNPNAGKSVFFNAFTGMYVDVSNYPGTTLEISHGRWGDDVIIDTPGVYGISSFNDEERIARDIILGADVVINVVNALYLERDLFLTQQIIDTGVPVVVALNMVDEAARQGLSIDTAKLSEMLGVPVVPTVAVKKRGFEQLESEIKRARPGHLTPGLEPLLKTMTGQLNNQGDVLLTLEGDASVAERHGVEPGKYRDEIYSMRRRWVNEIVSSCVKEVDQGFNFKRFLSGMMVHPFTGIPFLGLVLYVIYQVVGVFIAGTVVDFLENDIMGAYYQPFITDLVGHFVAGDSAIGTILVGEFGILTMTVIYVLGLLMPLVVGFYFFLSLFEDCGYLPRMAALMDRVLSSIGLNGRAIIPLILGFGCVTMATFVTRILGSDRERFIAIFLLGLVVPCSAQMAVVAGMLAGLGASYLVLYFLVICTVFIVAGTVLNHVLPGSSSHLLLDLPPLRLPEWGNVFKKTWKKSFGFLKEATPLFALGALIISIFQISGILTLLQKLLAPLTVGWLHLPREAATAFIMGIVRRDFGAAGFMTMDLTPLQTVVALITITLFVPCIASLLMIFKERGMKQALLICTAIWTIAFIVGGLVSRLVAAVGMGNITGALLMVVALGALGYIILLVCRCILRPAEGSKTL